MFTEEIENSLAISVSKDFLLDLENIIQKFFSHIYCVAILKNKERKTFESIKELCEYENALEKRIVKLEISAHGDENESLFLFFEGKEKTSIHGIVSTNEKSKTESICKKIDYATRRKSEGFFFSLMAKISYSEMLYVILIILMSIYAIIFPDTSSSNNVGIIEVLTKYLIPLVELVAIYMGFVLLIYKLKTYMWPIIVFDIGDEIKKNEKRKTLKKNLVWAGFFAIMASVVGSFIYAQLTNG